MGSMEDSLGLKGKNMRGTPTLITPMGSWSTIPTLLVKLQKSGTEIERVKIVATDNKKLMDDCNRIAKFTADRFPRTQIEFIVSSGVEDIKTSEDADTVRAAIIYAAALVAKNDLNFYCLSGGRKSMSSDLQFVASYFSAHKILHMLLPKNLENTACYEFYEESLKSGDEAVYLKTAHDFVLVEIPPLAQQTGYQFVSNEFESLIISAQKKHERVFFTPQCSLVKVSRTELDLFPLVTRSLESTTNLTLNFHRQISPPWNSLYLLAPNQLSRLQAFRIEPENTAVAEALLRKLPKAELHCHIGGILSLHAQINVGKELWNQMKAKERVEAEAWLNTNVELTHRLGNPQKTLQSKPALKELLGSAGRLRPAVTALLLHRYNNETLAQVLWDPVVERRALGIRNTFHIYEEPGELAGSAILRDRRCLGVYAKEIVMFCADHNLRILELRCSPAKYISNEPNGFESQFEFITCLREEIHAAIGLLPLSFSRPRVAIILICDRRRPESFKGTIDTLLAIQNDAVLRDFVVGVDVAGDEIISMTADEISDELVKVREHSLHTTVHAGETVNGGAVWTAVHRFSADRVGHALTLLNDPENGVNLIRKLKDRRITLELCPSSNREVVGYGFRSEEGTTSMPYPLREYLGHGLKVVICTDNPGISRTTPEREFLTASKLCKEPLNLFECLQLIKNSFTASFLPADELKNIMDNANEEVFSVLHSALETLLE